MMEKDDPAGDLAKVQKDLVEIEDLVYQIIFFSQNSQDPGYIKAMVTNLSKKVLDFLKIEHSDIEHLFKHEIEHHNYEVHVAQDESEHLHKTLLDQNEKIKAEVSKIPKLCVQFAQGKIAKDEFSQSLEKTCSSVLKLVGSEDHELGFIKDFMAAGKA